MAGKLKVFISYRNVNLSRDTALEMASKLELHGFEVFLDRARGLQAGDNWAEKIYTSIRACDVLLVILERGTSASDWVQREVDTARGAHISLLPIKISDDIDIDDELKNLAISDKQFLAFTGDSDLENLTSSLERLSKRTRNYQEEWIGTLQEKWRVQAAPDNPDYAIFSMPNVSHPCRIHLATGNMTLMKNIDVMVNSENNYMQMARIFESNTVSSVLRYSGSLLTKAGNLKEDTVQQELDMQLQFSEDYGSRPIQLGKVIATNAGHPKSLLRTVNKARFIFHVAAVSVVPTGLRKTLVPIETDDLVKEAVFNCLRTVLEVDEARGVISPEGIKQRELEEKASENYSPIKSIIFPLFGTGRGGRTAGEVLSPMVTAIYEFLSQNPDTALEHVYLCVYQDSDVEIAEALLERSFERER